MFKIGYYYTGFDGLDFSEIGYAETEEEARKLVAIGNNNCKNLKKYILENKYDDIEINEIGQPCYKGTTNLYMWLMEQYCLLQYKKIGEKATLDGILNFVEKVCDEDFEYEN